MSIARARRLSRIAIVWVKYGLDDVLLAIPYFRPARFLLCFNPIRWFYKQRLSRAERLCRALEELGPIFVKLGQVLSTRRDLLTPELIEALSKLQDQVKPFAGDQAKAIIESSLGKPIDELFEAFDIQALASASIAQVHAASLHTGQSVVVKVLRPNIERAIRQDISLMYTIARWVNRTKQGKRFRLIEVVAELERNLLNELDLMREAANASQFRRNFPKAEALYIPEVHWAYCSQNVLVLERIDGIPVDDVAVLKQQGTNLPLLAKRGVELFYTQVFRDNFFHADMHPGNIFVSKAHPSNPQYIAIDFGIVGSLDGEDKRYLLANFLAFFKRDYRRVAELHIESGWVPSDIRAVELEDSIRKVCEPIFEKPLKDISFGQTLMRLFQIAQQYQMEIQPQLLLLQKTLLNIEGMGRTLHPELNLWATAKPFLERWMKEQIGVAGLFKRFKAQWPYISDRLPEIPIKIHQGLQQWVEPAPQTKVVRQVVMPARRWRWFSIAGMILLAILGVMHVPMPDWLLWKAWLTEHQPIGFGVGVLLILLGLFFRR